MRVLFGVACEHDLIPAHVEQHGSEIGTLA
jgi:hypothetical protein